MPKKANRYAPEFRRQMVELVRAGRTPKSSLGHAPIPASSGPLFSNFWRGRIIGIKENNKDVPLNGFDEGDLNLAFLFGYYFPDISPELSEELAADAASGFVTDVLKPMAPTATPRIAVRVVGAQIDVPLHRDPILISAIDEDPRFHVIYEEDIDKRPERGTNKAEKARELQNFLDELDKERRDYEVERSHKK